MKCLSREFDYFGLKWPEQHERSVLDVMRGGMKCVVMENETHWMGEPVEMGPNRLGRTEYGPRPMFKLWDSTTGKLVLNIGSSLDASRGRLGSNENTFDSF
eukprot:comp16876_c3_seq1/m.15365 comp16876_c3_seq1/g.15365  ORF comp16876_c3_seq1/g.15365 comp16876_c3_seq1/m.15365 type:complete len:101 (-) comp16876_c3_seq1:224-526(-)